MKGKCRLARCSAGLPTMQRVLCRYRRNERGPSKHVNSASVALGHNVSQRERTRRTNIPTAAPMTALHFDLDLLFYFIFIFLI